MPLALPNDFVNDTTADAAPVQQNYQFIEQYVNANVITRDGAVGMNAPLLLNGAPTQPLHAATKAYVDSAMPIGIMLPFGGIAPPDATWALCNGASVSTATYAPLFAIIGYRFGGSGGAFLLPNMAGRMLVGVDPTEAEVDTVGEIGGTTAPPLASHTHNIDHTHNAVMANVEGEDHAHWMGHDHTAASATVSSDHSHNFDVNSEWGGTHGHGFGTRQDPVSGSAGSPGLSNAGGTIVTRTTYSDGEHNHRVYGTTGGITANHIHAITVNVNNMFTGGRSAGHTHYISQSPHAGPSSGPVQPVTAKYRPPYVTIAFIIRIA